MNKNGHSKLLAAVAVFAMVACVFAAVMPADVNAEDMPVTTGLTVYESGDITAAGTYYVSSETTVNVTAVTGMTIILADGASVSITGAASVSVPVYVATTFTAAAGTTEASTSYDNATSVTIGETADNSPVTVTAAYTAADAATGTTASTVLTVTSSVANSSVITAAVADDTAKVNVSLSGDVAVMSDSTSKNLGVAGATTTYTGNITVYQSASSGTVVALVGDVVAEKGITIKELPSTTTNGITGTIADGDNATVNTSDFKLTGTITYDGTGMSLTGTDMVTSVKATNNATVDGSTIDTFVISALTSGTFSGMTGDVSIDTASVTAIGSTTGTAPLDVRGISSITQNMTVNGGANAPLTGTFGGSVTIDSVVYNYSFSTNNFAGTVTYSASAHPVFGEFTTGQLNLLSGQFTATSDENIKANTVLYVGSNATVNLASDMTVEAGATLNLEGTIVGTSASGDNYIVIVAKSATAGVNDGTLNAFSGAALKDSYIAGDGIKNMSSAIESVEIQTGSLNSVKNEYSQFMNVVINQDLNITGMSTVTILGQLTVAQGVDVYVQAGSTLQIGKTIGSTTTYTIVADVDVQGTLNVDGTLDITSEDVTISNGGLVSIATSGALNVNAGDLTVETGSELEIMGTLTVIEDAATLENKGTITLDEARFGTTGATINMVSADAVLDIVTVTVGASGNTLTVTDSAITSDAIKSDLKTTNQITISAKAGTVTVVGIDISERIADGANALILAGSIGSDTTNGEITVSATGNGVVIADSSLGEGVTLSVAGETTVEGTMNVDDEAYIVGAGAVTVEGEIISAKKLAMVGDDDGSGGLLGNTEGITTINAAYYTVGTPAVHHYVSFDAAITSGAERVTIYGEVSATTGGTIPEGMTVSGQGTPVITVEEGVTLTVADGARVKDCGTIEVDGTLVVENSRNVSGTTINADVSKAVGNGAEYTNLNLALANADEGETVTIYRSPDAVVIDSDMEVPAGVTLRIDGGRSVTVNDEVTVTVNGTLFVNGGYFNVETAFADAASETSSKLIVNGLYQSLNSVSFDEDEFNVPGAYYVMVSGGQYYCIAPVEAAVTGISTYQNNLVAICGENTVGDITVTGESATSMATLAVSGPTEFGTVTLANAVIVIADETTGTIASAAGAMDLVNVRDLALWTATVEGTEYLYVVGKPVQADSTTENAPEAVADVVSGTVTVPRAADVIDSLASLATTYDASSVGTTVDAGATLSVLGTFADSETEVLGTLAVAEATASTTAGTARITELVVGANPYAASTGADATVTGTVATSYLDTVEVYAGGTFTQELPNSFKSTEYYVEDSLWLTVYTDKTVAINEYKPAKLTNSVFETWAYDNNGTMTTIPLTSTVSVGTYSAVYAEIDYNIYAVVVTADNGIGSVYIDGQAMVKYSNLFYMVGLEAGQHTITWETKNGFTGTVTMTVNGTAVSSGTLTFEGNELEALPGILEGVTVAGEQYVVYEITLNGTTAVTGGETSSDDGGMGLTDYLLIILVVLIVVMAIMVALRLMRS